MQKIPTSHKVSYSVHSNFWLVVPIKMKILMFLESQCKKFPKCTRMLPLEFLSYGKVYFLKLGHLKLE